jgi:hypothetical protein
VKPFRTFFCAAALCLLGAVSAQASIINLVHEFDGNSDGTTIFGTVELTQNGTDVDVEIIANTLNLDGGDIHEFYFNLPFAVTNLSVLNSGGTSDKAIGTFSIIGPNPTVVGGAGASFDWGVSFGNGAGTPGNGLLTTASFTLHADQDLLVSDLLAITSDPSNTPPVAVAVHFQIANIFGAGSETVGGEPSRITVHSTPEPASVLVWLGVACSFGTVSWLKRRRQQTSTRG